MKVRSNKQRVMFGVVFMGESFHSLVSNASARREAGAEETQDLRLSILSVNRDSGFDPCGSAAPVAVAGTF